MSQFLGGTITSRRISGSGIGAAARAGHLVVLCWGVAACLSADQCPTGGPPGVVTVTTPATTQATTCIQTSGTFTVTGTSTIVFQAGTTIYLFPGFTAQAGSSGTAFIASIGSVENIPSINTTPPPPSGVVGQSYPATYLSATGGSGSYVTWHIATGALPSGLTLNSSTGLISGPPTASGTYTFTVTVTDSNGIISPGQSFSITISGAPSPVTEYIRFGTQVIAIEHTSQ